MHASLFPLFHKDLAKGRKRAEEDHTFTFQHFMGPFDRLNLATACKVLALCERQPLLLPIPFFHFLRLSIFYQMCNMMKGSRRIGSFVEAARTIATHRGSGGCAVFVCVFPCALFCLPRVSVLNCLASARGHCHLLPTPRGRLWQVS